MGESSMSEQKIASWLRDHSGTQARKHIDGVLYMTSTTSRFENMDINSLRGLSQYIPDTVELSLCNNALTTFDILQELSLLPNLTHLHLSGNPICQYPVYRMYIVGILHGLIALDGVKVSSIERVQSKGLRSTQDTLIELMFENAELIDEILFATRVLHLRKELITHFQIQSFDYTADAKELIFTDIVRLLRVLKDNRLSKHETKSLRDYYEVNIVKKTYILWKQRGLYDKFNELSNKERVLSWEESLNDLLSEQQSLVSFLRQKLRQQMEEWNHFSLHTRRISMSSIPSSSKRDKIEEIRGRERWESIEEVHDIDDDNDMKYDDDDINEYEDNGSDDGNITQVNKELKAKLDALSAENELNTSKIYQLQSELDDIPNLTAQLTELQQETQLLKETVSVLKNNEGNNNQNNIHQNSNKVTENDDNNTERDIRQLYEETKIMAEFYKDQYEQAQNTSFQQHQKEEELNDQYIQKAEEFCMKTRYKEFFKRLQWYVKVKHFAKENRRRKKHKLLEAAFQIWLFALESNVAERVKCERLAKYYNNRVISRYLYNWIDLTRKSTEERKKVEQRMTQHATRNMLQRRFQTWKKYGLAKKFNRLDVRKAKLFRTHNFFIRWQKHIIRRQSLKKSTKELLTRRRQRKIHAAFVQWKIQLKQVQMKKKQQEKKETEVFEFRQNILLNRCRNIMIKWKEFSSHKREAVLKFHTLRKRQKQRIQQEIFQKWFYLYLRSNAKTVDNRNEELTNEISLMKLRLTNVVSQQQGLLDQLESRTHRMQHFENQQMQVLREAQAIKDENMQLKNMLHQANEEKQLLQQRLVQNEELLQRQREENNASMSHISMRSSSLINTINELNGVISSQLDLFSTVDLVLEETAHVAKDSEFANIDMAKMWMKSVTERLRHMISSYKNEEEFKSVGIYSNDEILKESFQVENIIPELESQQHQSSQYQIYKPHQKQQQHQQISSLDFQSFRRPSHDLSTLLLSNIDSAEVSSSARESVTETETEEEIIKPKVIRASKKKMNSKLNVTVSTVRKKPKMKTKATTIAQKKKVKRLNKTFMS